jgi:hypothetical protein
MKQSFLNFHSNATPLATFIDNQYNKVIGSMWVSSRGVCPICAGHAPFGDFDHQTPWIDII